MNNELLNHLKLSAERDWLQYYEDDWARNKNINPPEYLSKRLVQLTEVKLAQISAVIAQPQQAKNTKNIFLVEQQPMHFIASFFASVIAEVNLFLCDPAWQQQEWQQVLSLVKPDLVLGENSATDLIHQLDSASSLPAPIDQAGLGLSSRSLIMIPTGGTSGKLKFAIHSWQTLAASVEGFKGFFACQQINSCCTLPLYHVSGLMQLMRSFLTQGNLTFCSYKLITALPFTIDKSAYFISLIPTQLKFLLAESPQWLQEFSTILVGGAAISRSLLDIAQEYNLALAPIYGMTETASGVVALKPQDFLAGNYSNGKVMPHAQVSLKDSQTAAGTKNPVGLITINSSSLYLGYYPPLDSPPASLLTDDLGYFDHQGYLHIVGRNSQKIITGGENVFPVELEEVIYATKLVQDVCVIGIPDPKWGQAVTVIYVTTAANNLDLIKQQLRSRLAKYKQPKNWLRVERIPRNNRGKVNYQQLQAIALRLLDKNPL